MKIDDLIKETYKAHDNIALNAYRNIKSELQKVLTAKNAPEYSDELFLQVTAKYSKKLEDSISQFSEAHREDLVADYSSELEVVKKLLPEPVGESEILEYLINKPVKFAFEFPNHSIGIKRDENWNWIPDIPKKEMGNIIKHLKSKFPTADGKMISDVVKKYVI